MSKVWTCPKHGRFEEETERYCPLCELEMIHDNDVVLYSDGSGWNGNVSAFAVYTQTGEFLLDEMRSNLTNNQCEYMGLLKALELAPDHAVIAVDSTLAMQQVNGRWFCRDRKLIPLKETCQKLMYEKHCRVVWVPREDNKAGVEIERWQKRKRSQRV